MILKSYTKQKDFGRFSARWGCYATCLINIIEHELQRKLDKIELYSILGRWLITESVYLCNYKDHELIYDDATELPGWGLEQDPEIHYWVVNQDRALKDAMYIVSLKELTKSYMILKLDVGHFVLKVEHGVIINPDPSLDGKIIEWRKI